MATVRKRDENLRFVRQRKKLLALAERHDETLFAVRGQKRRMDGADLFEAFKFVFDDQTGWKNWKPDCAIFTTEG